MSRDNSFGLGSSPKTRQCALLTFPQKCFGQTKTKNANLCGIYMIVLNELCRIRFDEKYDILEFKNHETHEFKTSIYRFFKSFTFDVLI